MNKRKIDISIPEGFIKFSTIVYPNKKTVTICRYNQLKQLISKAFKDSKLNATVIFTKDDVDNDYFFVNNGEINVKNISKCEYKNLYDYYRNILIEDIIKSDSLSNDEQYFILELIFNTKEYWEKLNQYDRTPDI